MADHDIPPLDIIFSTYRTDDGGAVAEGHQSGEWAQVTADGECDGTSVECGMLRPQCDPLAGPLIAAARRALTRSR